MPSHRSLQVGEIGGELAPKGALIRRVHDLHGLHGDGLRVGPKHHGLVGTADPRSGQTRGKGIIRALGIARSDEISKSRDNAIGEILLARGEFTAQVPTGYEARTVPP